MDMHEQINILSRASQIERSWSQMTLSGMIDRLEGMNQDLQIDGIDSVGSYRGYYEDLAFSLSSNGKKMSVAEALQWANGSVGRVLVGYKGGDFLMNDSTPIWIADYGECGVKIVGINDDGTFETQEDN